MAGVEPFHAESATNDSKIDCFTLSVFQFLGPVILLVIIMGGSLKGATFGDGQRPATRYMIVVTGGELLAGVYPDGHTQFLTRTLHPLGLQCVGSMCVDDKRTDIEEALRFATGKAPLVIVTGGLGPTDNDITREALSAFTKIPLKENPDALKEMARR